MYDQESIKRFDNLTEVLRYDSQQKEKVLTAFERMYIQRERSQILNHEYWTIPEALELKVKMILDKIKSKK